VDELAIVKSWSKSDLGPDWKPPACTGWDEVGFTTLVTIAARFPHTSEAEGLLRRIGAISELAGMRYWSTTHKRWRTLIGNAYARSKARRAGKLRTFRLPKWQPRMPVIRKDFGHSLYLMTPTTSKKEVSMSQNHYVAKTKRRQKSGRRTDPTASTMATLKELDARDQGLESRKEPNKVSVSV
jgi:hypothetical protein